MCNALPTALHQNDDLDVVKMCNCVFISDKTNSCTQLNLLLLFKQSSYTNSALKVALPAWLCTWMEGFKSGYYHLKIWCKIFSFVFFHSPPPLMPPFGFLHALFSRVLL